jgi:hypothetical protein
MHLTEKWLDISRIIRNGKRVLDTQIPPPMRISNKSNRDKVLDVMRDSKYPLTFTEILYATEMKSSGGLFNVLRILITDKIIAKHSRLYDLL